MIRQRFDIIGRYYWTVYCYYVVHAYDIDEIITQLEKVGCRGKHLRTAYENISSGRLDTGLAYTNHDNRKTVIVIAKTSSALEFAQSWTHEVGHLADHIAQYYEISPHGEEIRYLQDSIIVKMWPIAKDLLCECCRNKRFD